MQAQEERILLNLRLKSRMKLEDWPSALWMTKGDQSRKIEYNLSNPEEDIEKQTTNRRCQKSQANSEKSVDELQEGLDGKMQAEDEKEASPPVYSPTKLEKMALRILHKKVREQVSKSMMRRLKGIKTEKFEKWWELQQSLCFLPEPVPAITRGWKDHSS